ncbi:hypothetical protein FHK87_15050 [Aquimarina algicola]|uniref:Uncharacterized protein n=2 Tax=Aquimarina algicola TaxID=2589995 RepID=A0A504J9Y3_9FLAO|nr:hypothetical protein FHK87_15050 [Aquimarina algicola]
MLVALGIIVLSMLPFLHDIITERGEGVRSWIPVIGIQDILTDKDGGIMGFSTYRIFLYQFFQNLLIFISLIGWYIAAKGKRYRFVLWVPMLQAGYTLLIQILNARTTVYSKPDVRFIITIVISIIIVLNYFRNRRKKLNNEQNQQNSF